MNKIIHGGFTYQIENEIPDLNGFYIKVMSNGDVATITQRFIKRDSAYSEWDKKIVASDNPYLNSKGIPSL